MITPQKIKNTLILLQQDPWYKTKCKAIRDLIDKYPPGTSFEINGRVCWIIAYTEGKNDTAWGFRLTYINPMEDSIGYEMAKQENFSVCINCFENNVVCKHERIQ